MHSNNYTYVNLRQKPQLKEQIAPWFHDKWKVPKEDMDGSFMEITGITPASADWNMTYINAVTRNRFIKIKSIKPW